MTTIKLSELGQMNSGLFRSRPDSGEHTLSASAINCTFMNGTYVNDLNRVLSAITEIRDIQKMMVKRKLQMEAELAMVQIGGSYNISMS